MNPSNDHHVRDWLALLTIVGGGYLLESGESELRMVVSSMVTMVLSFYFGSSHSNAANRQTIDKMVDAQTDAAKLLAEKVPNASAQAGVS